MTNQEFIGATCIVTGGACGIGLSIAKAFSDLGADVVIVDIDREKSKVAIDLINTESGRMSAKFMTSDLSQDGEAGRVVSEIIDNSKNSNFILVNNARSGQRLTLFEENEVNWDFALSVGLKAAFFASQMLVKRVADTQIKATVCNIGSVASFLATNESASYHAMKAGMLQITRYLALHAGQYGVRVNCVLPGLIVQERHRGRFYRDDNESYRNMAYLYQPLGQVGSEADVANAVIWLCSKNAQYVSGVHLLVDGGATIQEQFSALLRIN